MNNFDIFAMIIFMFIPIAILAGGLVWTIADDEDGVAGAIGIIFILGFFFFMIVMSATNPQFANSIIKFLNTP